MKQMFLKQTMIAGLLFLNLGILGGCTSLEGSDEQVFEPDVAHREVAPAFSVDAGICSPENPSACIVSFEDADVMLVLTEWCQFKGLDLARAKSLMRGNKIIDLRNQIDHVAAVANGFEYKGVGRPLMKPKK